MAATLRTNASRVIVNSYSWAIVRRSFPRNFIRFTAAEHHAASRWSVFSRRGHSLARKTAHDIDLEPNVPTSPSVDIDLNLPRFDSLKDAMSTGTLEAIIRRPFGLTHMSPVQAEVLPLLPQISEPYNAEPSSNSARRLPRDLLVRAKTGTGKTLAFLVPAIEARLKSIQAFVKQAVADSGLTPSRAVEERARRSFTREHVGTLILSPTRELATQIASEAVRLCSHHPGMGVRLFTGGVGKGRQMREWAQGRCDIVVATPGRMRDILMSESEIAKAFSKTKLLVLDETDTLLDIGFRDDIDAIKGFLPPTPERQTFLFSATVSRSIQQVARSSLEPNHLFINTVTDNTSPVHAHVQQYHTVLPNAGHQIPHLLRLLAHDQLSNPGKSKIIIFLPTTKMTQLFTMLLLRLSNTTLPAGTKTNVYEIHSKRDQRARTRTSDAFRNDKSGAAILVSSDVSARGIDYPGVTRVIQVGIPGGTEQYVHRVGRTGRAGTEGRGDLVLLPWEISFVSSHLTEMPLKPLTVNELASQVQELAAQYDSDASSFSKGLPQSSSRAGARSPPFTVPVTRVIENAENNISELVQNLDKEAVNETFTSLLGYYIAKSTELRVSKSDIVQGCKDWTMEACGLPIPPYVSEMFLQKLGVLGETKPIGRGYRHERPGRSWNSWEGRGQQRSRRVTPIWGSSRNDEDHPGGFDRYRSGEAMRRDFEDDLEHPTFRRSSNFQRSDRGTFERRDRREAYGKREGREYRSSEGGGTFREHGSRDFEQRARRPQRSYGLGEDR